MRSSNDLRYVTVCPNTPGSDTRKLKYNPLSIKMESWLALFIVNQKLCMKLTSDQILFKG